MVTFQQITFKLGNCTNVKVLFPVLLMDFPLLGKKGLLLGITTEKIRQIILRFCETAGTYPSPKPIWTLSSYLGNNVGFKRKGVGGQFPRNVK